MRSARPGIVPRRPRRPRRRTVDGFASGAGQQEQQARLGAAGTRVAHRAPNHGRPRLVDPNWLRNRFMNGLVRRQIMDLCLPVGLGGIWDQRVEADAQPRTPGDELPQAVGTSTPSRPDGRCHRGFRETGDIEMWFGGGQQYCSEEQDHPVLGEVRQPPVGVVRPAYRLHRYLAITWRHLPHERRGCRLHPVCRSDYRRLGRWPRAVVSFDKAGWLLPYKGRGTAQRHNCALPRGRKKYKPHFQINTQPSPVIATSGR